MTVQEHAAALSEGVLAEILYAFSGKRSGWLQGLIKPLARKPAKHFGNIVAEFYDQLNREGIRQGAQQALTKLNHAVETRGTDAIPLTGSLLLVSNHPGGLDSLSILSCLPRNDLKVLVTDVKFLRLLDYLKRYLIFVDFTATGGMLALRDAIRHLESGGMLLLFAHGDVEPEPESYPAASDEINQWSPSIEILLRKVPETLLQIVTVSGAVQARYLRNPLTCLRRQPARRQKLAEFLQVIQCLLLPHTPQINLHITFGSQLKTRSLGEGRWMPVILTHAKTQFDDHLNWVRSISPKP
ncbi:MAG: hypothetical protein JXR32_06335 [Anaerolineaceae bacterium]|nr:hypothetical protein [Anaerolineaceae bacterium]